jgi:hypothetical protein
MTQPESPSERPSPISALRLGDWFTHHPPKNDEQIQGYVQIRNAGHDFARTIVANCPPSADTTAAVRKVREAVMTANAAIACEGR